MEAQMFADPHLRAVICNSEMVRQDITRRYPHLASRLHLIHNGIDLTHEAPSAPDVVAAGLEAGLVLNATGPHTLRFLPPLICTEADVDVLVQKLEQLL